MKFPNLKQALVASLTISMFVQSAVPAFAQQAPAPGTPEAIQAAVAKAAEDNGFHPDIFTQNPYLGGYIAVSTIIDAAFAGSGLYAANKMNKEYQEGLKALQTLGDKVAAAKKELARVKHLPLHKERLEAMKGLQSEIQAMRDMHLGRTPHIHEHTVTELSENAKFHLLSEQSQTSIAETELRIQELEASKLITRDVKVIEEYEKTIHQLKLNIVSIRRSDEVYASYEKWMKTVRDYDRAGERLEQGVMRVIEQRLEQLEGTVAYTESEREGLVEGAKETMEEYASQFNTLSKSVLGRFGSGTLRWIGVGVAVLMVLNIGAECYQVMVLNQKPSLVPLVSVPAGEVGRWAAKK